MKSAWSEEEVDWIEQHPRGSYEDFCALFPGRTYDAWRLKRQGVKRSSHLVPMITPQGQVVGDQLLVVPPDGEDLEEYFAQLEQAVQTKHHLSFVQKETSFTPPDEHLPIAVVFTGDWHIGASGVDYDALRSNLEAIAATEGAYAIGMGDFVEGVNANIKAKSALYSGAENNTGLQEDWVALRAGICKGKWLAFMSGNHDEWLYSAAGKNRIDEIAGELQAPYFSQGGGIVRIWLGTNEYVIGVRHTTSGSSRLNTSNAQRRMFDDYPEWDNLHVAVVGHHHYNDMHVQSRKGYRCVYLRAGTFKTHDSYARDNGFTPELGTPLVILLPDQHKVLPYRGDDFEEGMAHFRWLRQEYKERAP